MRSIPGYTPPDNVVDDYIASYAGSRFVDSINYVRSYPHDLQELATLLPTINTPVTILAARNDPYLPIQDAEQIQQAVPNGTLIILENFHNAWEEDPATYAEAIDASLSR